MAPTIGTAVVCALLLMVLRVPPSNGNDYKLELSNFKVYAIYPEEYKIEQPTTITFSADLREKGSTPDATASNITIFFIVIRLMGEGNHSGQTIGTVSIPRNPEEQGTVRNVREQVMVRVTEDACGTGSSKPDLCAGATFDKEHSSSHIRDLDCLEFVEIEKGGAGKVDCEDSNPLLIPVYAVIPIIIVSVVLILVIYFVCKREWKKRRGRTMRDGDQPNNVPRGRAVSLAHIYDEIHNRLSQVHLPFGRPRNDDSDYESRLAKEGRRENEGFHSGNENPYHTKLPMDGGPTDDDSAPSSSHEALSMKRPSQPNEYIERDLSLMCRLSPPIEEESRDTGESSTRQAVTIEGITEDSTSDQMETAVVHGDWEPATPDFPRRNAPILDMKQQNAPDTPPSPSLASDTASDTNLDPDPRPEIKSSPSVVPDSPPGGPDPVADDDDDDPYSRLNLHASPAPSTTPEPSPPVVSAGKPELNPKPKLHAKPVVDPDSGSTEEDQDYVKPQLPRKQKKTLANSADGIVKSAVPTAPQQEMPMKPKLTSKSEPDLPSEDKNEQDLSTSSTSSTKVSPRPPLPAKPTGISPSDRDIPVQTKAPPRPGPELPAKPRRASQPGSDVQVEDRNEQDFSSSSTSSTKVPPRPDLPAKPRRISQTSLQENLAVDPNVIKVAIARARESTVKAPNPPALSPKPDFSDPGESNGGLASPNDQEFIQAVMENYLALMSEVSKDNDDYEVAIGREQKRADADDGPVVEPRLAGRRKSYSAQLTLKRKRKTIQSGEIYVNQWNKSWEFDRNNLEVDREKPLGEGQFGKVYKALAKGVKGREGTVLVAVKELKDGADMDDKDEFLKELAIHTIMKPHPHVVELLGCCIRDDPICIITEYLSGGSLLGFLRSQPVRQTGRKVVLHYLAKFGLHIARGMAHVSQMKIVHRDLAARNILVGKDQVCKVADFGFARDVFGIQCYLHAPDKAPIRWYAPESILDNLFSTKSDVWSFGILLFEIATLGRVTPYQGLNNEEVRISVSAGRHPNKPPHCDGELFDIMKKCWARNVEDRPSFHELVTIFEDIQILYPDPSMVDPDALLNEEDEEEAF